MDSKYKGRRISALDAQRAAHEIAFAPVVFQVSRLMINYGIFEMLEAAGRSVPAGLTAEEVAEKAGISVYGAKVLLESSLTAGTVFLNDGRFTISKVGWFLLNDPMVRSDIDFNHDVNYKGLFHLDEAVRTGKPAGLKELGPWPTLYEGLSSLEPKVQKSWFGFDHFYSDNSFEQALPHIFASPTATILDIDGKPGAERIHTVAGDLLNPETVIPGGFDVVWMSQFLDCFSEQQVVSILSRVASGLKPGARVYIMETLWDRQKFDTASFDLAQTSVYFTAMANGNSKMFYSNDLFKMIETAGLRVGEIVDNLGYGHSLIRCSLANA